MIWGKLYSTTAKKWVCYQHKFETSTVPAAKKKTLSHLKPGQALKGKQQQTGAVPAEREERSTLSLASTGFDLSLMYTSFSLVMSLAFNLFVYPSQ